MKRFFVLTFLMFMATGLVSNGVALAQALTPDALVKSVTDDVLKTVRQDKDIQNGNSQKTIALVQAKVLPSFNFNRMTSLAVGRDWNKATPQQKEQLTNLFRDLLVRTYSNALSSYRDQTVRYKPFTMQPEETDVLVRTEVLQPGGRPIQLDYSLNLVDKGKDGGWKVYDVVVGGVSLVTNYRDTFAQEVRNGGIDGLIQSLADKNRALEKKAQDAQKR
ncbi:MAG: ABC transporter substrate-binding protein [Zoogloeaceae bacterium]|jgi:phospholipid transport system substrate-binding protein|nr:ABC transporter substrate-binding protein [Zoogloeaceae bacterium]